MEEKVFPNGGQWIVTARQSLGQSVKDFCSEVHISPSTYQKIRRGEKVDVRCLGRIFVYLLEFLQEEEYQKASVDCTFYFISLVV